MVIYASVLLERLQLLDTRFSIRTVEHLPDARYFYHPNIRGRTTVHPVSRGTEESSSQEDMRLSLERITSICRCFQINNPSDLLTKKPSYVQGAMRTQWLKDIEKTSL